MATITETPRTTGIPRRWRVAGAGLVVAGLLGVGLTTGTLRALVGPSAPALPPTVAVTRGGITASVDGIGTVAAAKTLDLTFSTTGTVTDVLVHEGDMVAAGQPIARIDDRILQSQVASAEANLVAAQARLAQAQKGNANSEDVAAARAQLASAQASYDKLAAGPSAADVANAQATLRSAEANLKDTLAGPTPSDVAAAEATVRSAESQLASAQKDLADLKAQPKPEDVQNAELALEQAKDSLWSAQLSRDATCGPSRGQGGVCQSANATVAAQETAVNQAAAKLAQVKEPPTAAQLAAAEQAVRSAQAGLDSAHAKLAQVKAGPTAASRQSAQSQVDEAKASLVKAETSVTPEDLAVVKASVDQAKANLAKLTAPATDTDLAIQQANVSQAEQSLKQARLSLENAILKAPFAGIVSAVNVVPGSSVGGGTVIATLVDRGTVHVDLKLSENDVVKVAVGQPATLTSDSLAGWSAKGTVSYIAPAAQVTNGVETFLVRVSFPGDDPSLRVGMTANVEITTAHHDNVILVPSTALLPKGAGHIVERPSVDGKAIQDIEVTTGLTDGAMTEITSGLTAGDRVIALPTTGASHSSNSFFGH
ncbi:MAG TPA: efflux RND transporter periplasmic adaptor subunit [Chloroflexota bacterium]|nr:efflux RND transporter periplasmic adaptor subunit [Chloroflexota bacterium]